VAEWAAACPMEGQAKAGSAAFPSDPPFELARLHALIYRLPGVRWGGESQVAVGASARSPPCKGPAPQKAASTGDLANGPVNGWDLEHAPNFGVMSSMILAFFCCSGRRTLTRDGQSISDKGFCTPTKPGNDCLKTLLRGRLGYDANRKYPLAPCFFGPARRRRRGAAIT